MRHRLFRWRLGLGAAIIVAVASCAPAPRPQMAPPPPAPAPATRPAPPAPAPVVMQSKEWDEQAVTEGAWSYNADRLSARFVDDSGLERASLTCNAADKWIGLALSGDAAPMVEVLTSAGRSQHPLANGRARFAVGDVALDRMAFSRGRFALRASALLVLPVQSEIGRVIEDCRG